MAGFAAVLVVATQVDSGSGSGLRIAIRAVGLVAYGGMYLLQRSADRVHHYHQPDAETAYDSLWGPGLAAVFSLGLIETITAYGIAG